MEAAKRAGFKVSEKNFPYWQRKEILPRPRQESLGRRGSVVQYPAGTSRQLIAICQLQQETRLLNRIGWGLWWLGFDVGERYWRPVFSAKAERWDTIIRQVREAAYPGDKYANGISKSFLSAFEAGIENVNLNPVIRGLRKRLGLASFPLLLPFLVDFVIGRYGINETSARERNTIIRSFGLHRALHDRLPGISPWSWDDIHQTLTEISRCAAASKSETYGATTRDELFKARNELRSLIHILNDSVAFIEPVFGKHAFGFGSIRKIAALTRPTEQAGLLLGWLHVRALPWIQPAVGKFIDRYPVIEKAKEDFAALQKIGAEDSTYAHLLTPVNIAAAIRSPLKMEELQHELKRQRKRRYGR